MIARAALLAIAVAAALGAHMVSISNGELTVEGNQMRYELRVPLFEVAHVEKPERDLIAAVRFRSGGEAGKPIDTRCRRESGEGVMICEARYEFPGPIETFEAESSLHQVTVPNHVHLLRATRGGVRDQAVLDLSFPRAELRFRPPSAMEIATRQTLVGVLRAAGGPAQWLFLAALAIAARSRRELALLAGMFLAGETVSAVATPLTGWAPEPRFVEVACALTIAYLAVEILWLAQAGQRWAVVGVLGLFHGLYFAIFLAESDYRAGYVLAGGYFAELVILAAVAWILAKAARPLAALQPARIAAAALLVTGLSWFFWRLRG